MTEDILKGGGEMTEKSGKRSLWTNLSIVCIGLGILCWIMTFIGMPGLWALTLIINPLGCIFAAVGRLKDGRTAWWLIINILMTFSFVIVMLLGYAYMSMTHGKL